jgi:predicted translin family RNA/ssDNA-binding protein
MQSESLQTGTLVVVAVVLLFQATLLISMAVSLAKISKSLEELNAEVSAFLAAAKSSVGLLELRIRQITQTAQNQLQRVDMTIELLARSKTHAVAFDKLLGDVLRTADYANEEIERTTRRVFREAHAVNAGVRALLGYLLARRDK